MGNKSAPSSNVSDVTQMIDNELKREEKIRKKKLVLLGPESSGKSTLLNTLSFIHHDDTIQQETVAICIRMWCYQQALYLCAIIGDHESYAELQQLTIEHAADLSSIANISAGVWAQTRLQNMYKTRYKRAGTGVRFADNIGYFFDNIVRIMLSDYKPSREDILRCPRKVHQGLDTFSYYLHHAGQIELIAAPQSWPHKKLYMFDNVHACIFVVPLSDYCLPAPDGTNALVQHVKMFDRIVNNKCFRTAESILVLNKDDIFQTQLKSGIPFARFRDCEYIKQILDGIHDKRINKSFVIEDEANYEMIAPHYIRKNSDIAFSRIPLVIIELVQQYVSMQDPFQDNEALFAEYHQYAIDCIWHVFMAQNRHGRRIRMCRCTKPTSAINVDSVGRLFWDVENAIIPGALAYGGIM